VIALKFLAPGAVGPFSGYAWPTPDGAEPGAWVEAVPSLCASGIHACRPSDLPFWLHAELWRIELEDAVQGRRKLVALRGRLLDRVAGWDAEAQRELGEWCAAKVAALAEQSAEVAVYAADASEAVANGDNFLAAYIAARAAEIGGGPEAYEQERAAQACWLADRLGLEPAP
jgi:hypothetical protein